MGFQYFDYDLCMYGFFSMDPAWDSLYVLDAWFDVFHLYGKNFQHYIIKHFFYPILLFVPYMDSNYMYVGLFDVLPQISEALFFFFFRFVFLFE